LDVILCRWQVVPHGSKDSTAIIFKGQVVLNHLPSNTALLPRRLDFSKGFFEFLTLEDETAIRIHQQLVAFYGDSTVDISTVNCEVRKSRDSGRHLDLNNLPQS